MRQATVRSRCECQASLVATLNEKRHVLSAHAADRQGNMESAPAHSMAADGDRFDVGWLCGFCGRNTLRSFSAEALGWTEVAEGPEAGAK
jgi:hypothetical protein